MSEKGRHDLDATFNLELITLNTIDFRFLDHNYKQSSEQLVFSTDYGVFKRLRSIRMTPAKNAWIRNALKQKIGRHTCSSFWQVNLT